MSDDHNPEPDPPERPDDSPKGVRKRIRDRTIARWTDCEAERKAALDAGKSEDEAHEAAKAVWNGWAEQMLADKEKLVDERKWAVGAGQTVFGFWGEVGTNQGTQDWLEKAATSFHSVRLRSASGEDRQEGESASRQSTSANTLSCVGAIIRFQDFLFPGQTDFGSAKFSGDAHFYSAKFSSVASFDSATFRSNASFDSTTFSGNAWFDSATFRSSASFDSTTFSGNAQFYSATFRDIASFNRATFGSNAWFDSTTFSGNAHFYSATFNDVASFNSATFEGNAWFDNATFSSIAWFDSATFRGNALFGLSGFDGNTSFDGAKFAGEADFGAIDASRAFSLADTRFETRVPGFIQAHFTEALRLDNVSVPIPSPLTHRPFPDTDDPARYRALARLAIQGHDHEQEMLFFKGLKSAELLLEREPFWSRQFNRIYWMTSDYGRSFVRPFSWLFATTWAFAGIYLSKANPAGDCQDVAFAKSAFLALANALPAISGAQRQSILKAYACLYPAKVDPAKYPDAATMEAAVRHLPPDIPVAVAYLGVFQTLLSVTFLFLIALALRNMFRIK
ncbi:pentapeptide repeat-containing protein [Rhodobium gokarnense]|uniref:Pentapeptide repeat-containing protein n=1 Tax=Rhodobium gokarnense TaxID=364296 RepID=A0ABT3HHJ6_9HYPH|nr:pentapeptide repeat-containing protein [Rhodobium gokarnense]MCW2309860.1 hypothetical protein [Rhodobium gokarnense]